MSVNSSSMSLLARSKKLPPPPLCLPATNPTTDEEKIQQSNQQRERKKSANSCCCLSSSTEDCPHKSIPYILPASQRPQILETLMSSSSVLLVQSSSTELKNRKSYTTVPANQINVLKQRQSSSKVTVTDAEWIDFMRFIIHKPLENELKSLLDKYKMTYFDQVNAPNTTDDTIRSSLCAIATEALGTYSSTSTLLPPPLSTTSDELIGNPCSPISTSINAMNGSSKRKRKNTIPSASISAPATINSRTKFVVSYITPGKHDSDHGGNKTTIQQKHFQKKYSHLFKYIPDHDEQEYLNHEGHLKCTSSISTSPDNSNACLMLYDEVSHHMDEYDLELSGISMNDTFILPESMLVHINSSIQ